jgi:cytochrome c551/c552
MAFRKPAQIWRLLPVLAIAIAPCLVAWQQSSAPAQRALVNQYCVACHDNATKTAGLSLEGRDISKVGEDAGTWEKVLQKVGANLMPPADMPHPDAAASRQFAAYLESELDKYAAAHPDPGRPTIHRLNRAEYSNAIRDLLALDINPGSTLPADDTGYGFDNIGDVLSLSPILIERYMTAGRMVSRLAAGDRDVKPVVDVFAPPREARAAPKAGLRIPRTERIDDDLPFDSAGGLSFQHTFPLDAEYVFKIQAGGPGGGGASSAGGLELRIPVKAGVRHVSLTSIRSGAMPEVIPALGRNQGGPPGGPPQTGHLDLRLDGVRLKLFEVPGGNNGAGFSTLSIGGPYNVSGPGDSPSRRRIFVCNPASAQEEQPCARKILASLVRRAYRRPYSEEDLKPLLALYEKGRRDPLGGGFEGGIEMALRGILVSPDFLFRIERDPAGSAPGGVHRVNDFELASRLSFFLWSSIPDEELLNLAQEGKLSDPKTLERQTARMLDDPKSKAFIDNFSGQYLFVRNLAAQKPDPDEFPEFDNALRRAFERETTLFFNAIVRENRPVTELIDAKFTFLNERLAEFYGVPGVHGPQFRRVEITDPNRGGILGQGSLLTVTSYPNRTSVVQRGKWVLENLLGTPPPPPPPNVPSLDPHGKDGNLTMRQAMEAHRANPVCASCHSRMDPIGFSLENYNGVGAWRDKDNGAAIDPTGKLPDGTVFTGPAGLKQLLLTQHRDEFLSTFTEKLMTYALGRGLDPSDRPAVRAILRDAAKQDDTIPALIDAIVGSPQFQMRRNRSL